MNSGLASFRHRQNSRPLNLLRLINVSRNRLAFAQELRRLILAESDGGGYITDSHSMEVAWE